MQKIPTLFVRDPENMSRVLPKVNPDCQWVIDGEGEATLKYDGACCMVQDGKLYKRRELKRGDKWPDDFEPATDVDPNTGKVQGWVPVGEGPEDRWFREAFSPDMPNGTYELCGPKVQGNPHGYERHVLIPHGEQSCPHCPREFYKLRDFFAANVMEGVVWHHPDGRMAKIKRRDFGFSWPQR